MGALSISHQPSGWHCVEGQTISQQLSSWLVVESPTANTQGKDLSHANCPPDIQFDEVAAKFSHIQLVLFTSTKSIWMEYRILHG